MRARRVLLALAGVLVAAGCATAAALAHGSGGVTVREYAPLSPEVQRYVEDPAVFEEFLRSHPPTPLMPGVRK
ncbi:hypothetical protein [Kitasatospora sp. NPDC091207]|uniref:hypothetical protein n=1 Tax=Kitasatospora sp. NPDC091207 TaxID=3364083 RepID=UPI0038155ACB